MKNIEKILKPSAIIALILILLNACNVEKDQQPANGLVERIAPQLAGDIVFEQIDSPSGKDIFELESLPNGKIMIRGNNPISMAMSFNHYLKYYCKTSVSWFADQPVQLPETLPNVPDKIIKEAKVDKRFFLNYCTFGYTLPWWQWKDWERLIDWMALNGINMPLAITGQEAIWQKVWSDFGLTDNEIRSFFSGPTHLPWNRMMNIDKWGGPLPQSYIDHQFDLQKMILKRERELGMKPVLPGFNGHVPKVLKDKYPDAKIKMMKDWVGFLEEYRTYILDPMDSLFYPIQKAFLEEQTKQFGTDHLYGVDPLVEIKPLSWELDYLDKLSKTIYGSMADVDSLAEWVQMSWSFYYDKEWTKDRIKSFLTAIPQGKMTMLDYFCEAEEVWKRTESFFGQNYLWCYLGNFGENNTMAGNMVDINIKMDTVFVKGGDNLKGVGCVMEGLDVNPLMYEFVFGKVWDHKSTDVQAWIANWADRRAGYKDENVRQAWQVLYENIYSKLPRLFGSTLNFKPTLAGRGYWDTYMKGYAFTFPPKEEFQAWELLLKAEDKSRDALQYDIVNVGRQALSDYFIIIHREFTDCYYKKDLPGMKKNGERMIELLSDLDKLVATRKSLLLGHWIEDARLFGKDSVEADYYEQNARNILTTWGSKGSSLTDYSNRHWAGLINTYYTLRWEMFIDKVISSVEQGKEYDDSLLKDKFSEFEWNWALNKDKFQSEPSENSIEIAEQLIMKYKYQILK